MIGCKDGGGGEIVWGGRFQYLMITSHLLLFFKKVLYDTVNRYKSRRIIFNYACKPPFPPSLSFALS